MSFTSSSLAVTYRPTKLSQVVGQEAVISQIQGILTTKRVPNSILLSGPSGMGKTTLARIIARYLNCQTYNSCGKCPSCLVNSNHPDVVEINIGDQRGIDDIRGLIVASRNRPRFNYRVFILDECQQLTPQALSALLKPTEESSDHTIWVLATTNPEKFPTTLLSRCLRLNLRPIKKELVVQRLAEIAVQEKFQLTKEQTKFLGVIASITNGQMRDSIQMLEQMLFALASGRDLKKDDLISFIAAPEIEIDKAAVYVLIALQTNNLPVLIRQIRTVKNNNPTQVRQLLSKLRWLVQYLIDDYAEITPQFRPYSVVLYFRKVAKLPEISTSGSILLLLAVQRALLLSENEFNSLNIDESVVLLSNLSTLVTA